MDQRAPELVGREFGSKKRFSHEALFSYLCPNFLVKQRL